MSLMKRASSGTMESSDVYVEIEPAESGLDVRVESVVKKQFGDRIESTVREVLSDQGVESATVRIVDRGALDCVLRARVETAVRRGRGEA